MLTAARIRAAQAALLGSMGLLLALALIAVQVESLLQIRETTDRYQRAAFAITDLSSVQRELLALGRDLERLGTFSTPRDIDVRIGLLGRQWGIASDGRASRPTDGPNAMTTFTPVMDGVLDDVRAHVAANPAGGQVPDALRARLDAMEVAVKQEFDRREIAYVDTFRASLQVRSDSQARILVALAVLLLAVAATGIVGVRSLRRSEATVAGVEREYQELVEQVREGIVKVDRQGRLELVNPGWSTITGLTAEESLGRPLADLLDARDHRGVGLLRAASNPDGPLPARLGGADVAQEIMVRLPGPEARWGELSLVRRPAGGWAGTLMDVSEEVAARDALRRQATRDALTGLANRTELVEQITRALATAERQDRQVGLIFIDLDRFKLINDSMGHDAGDQLLAEIAVRIRATLRASDTGARLGGDEFVVLIESLPSSQVEALRLCRALAERIAAVISEPVTINDREVVVRASLGLSLGAAGQDADSLLAEGDTAMYRAKELGKDRIEVFDDVLHARVRGRVEIEHALHAAVARHQLRLWLQPVVDLATGRPHGAEALLRWEHPERGLIAPGQFLEIAEDTGTIVEIGAWVIQTACRTAAAWTGEMADWTISVNVSAAQLVRSDVRATVLDALSGSGLPADRLMLEITESVYLSADASIVGQLASLSRAGVRLAMDDFGTGYSSLSSLRMLPVDVVKLDRSYVSGLGMTPDDQQIVRSIIDLGQNMGLATIAEGVESEEQRTMLLELGCQAAQGFLFSPPMPAEDLDATGRCWTVAVR